MDTGAMRLRQIALVARDLDPVAADLTAVLGLDEPFRDPGVAEFGLHNVVYAIGDTFLEVVSPFRADATAARYLQRRGGDGGYMAIFQSADLAAERARLTELGVRVVWEIALDDIATLHLHPRDVGGAIVSIDEARPPASWRWAGPGWERRGAATRAGSIAGVEIASEAPESLARRWASVLGRGEPRSAPTGEPEIPLDRGGVVRFSRAAGSGEGIATVLLAACDAGAVRDAARARGCLDAAGEVRIGGVRFALDAPG